MDLDEPFGLPLQGGGRWFEPSIAHLEKAAICRGNAAQVRGPEYASRLPLLQPYCNPTGTGRHPLDKAGTEMIEDTRKRTCWLDTLVWSRASWFILVMRRDQRFESARRLSCFCLQTQVHPWRGGQCLESCGFGFSIASSASGALRRASSPARADHRVAGSDGASVEPGPDIMRPTSTWPTLLLTYRFHASLETSSSPSRYPIAPRTDAHVRIEEKREIRDCDIWSGNFTIPGR